MQIQDPFHAGELAVQELAGETGTGKRSGTMIVDTIMAGALPFLRQQRMFIVGSSSPLGDLWASVLFGPPGFVESEDGKAFTLNLPSEARDEADPLWQNIVPGGHLGGLAIDLFTRRRLRVNGRVVGNEPGLLSIAVDEAYPNCPKYIQQRVLRLRPELKPEPGRVESGTAITDAGRGIIEEADTLFVATSNPKGGTDVSHRGGPPGFVKVINEDTFSVPDYRGNGMFNTLGNLALNPAAGILIVDFPKHRILQMTGKARIQWHEVSSAQFSAETGRSWIFHIDRWHLRPLPAAFEWEFVGASPFNPR